MRRILITGPLSLGLAVSVVAYLLSLAAPSIDALALLTHFRIYHLGATAVLVGLLFILRRYRFAVAGLLLCTLLLFETAPYLFFSPPAGRQDDVQGADLRVYLANVLTSNRQYRQTVEQIRQASPDLIIIEEMNLNWQRYLDQHLPEWPHRLSAARGDNFGIGLYSRHKLLNGRTLRHQAGLPTLTAQLVVKGRPVFVVATHPLPPLSLKYMAMNRQQLEALAGLVSDEEQVLLIGDLNTTPWSPVFSRLLEAGLKDARIGFGVLATWPASLPVMIAIDHCLYKGRFRPLKVATGNRAGSDHLPLICDFAVEP